MCQQCSTTKGQGRVIAAWQILSLDSGRGKLASLSTQSGTGKNKGLLGALTAETDDGNIRVNIGTGFSDEQRKLFTEEFVMGKIVEIEYNQRISSGGGRDTDSLFLPRFIELREDKDHTNSSVGVV